MEDGRPRPSSYGLGMTGGTPVLHMPIPGGDLLDLLPIAIINEAYFAEMSQSKPESKAA